MARVGPRLLWEAGMDAPQSHLEVAVDQKVGLKVIVVLTEGIDELLGHLKGEGVDRQSPANPACPTPGVPTSAPPPPPHLEPAGIEEELQQGEDGHTQVQVVTLVALSRVQELATDEAGQEVAVHSDGHHLGAGWVTGSGFSRSREVLERPGLGMGHH